MSISPVPPAIFSDANPLLAVDGNQNIRRLSVVAEVEDVKIGTFHIDESVVERSAASGRRPSRARLRADRRCAFDRVGRAPRADRALIDRPRLAHLKRYQLVSERKIAERK